MQQNPNTEKSPEESFRLRTHPIADRTRKTYLGMVAYATRYSVAKRTSDWDEPAPARLTDIVEDYFSREDISAGTKNTMRSALIWFIESGETKTTPDALAALAKLRALESPRGRKPKGKRRANTIPPEDLTALLRYLTGKTRSKLWAYRTASWIRAGLACGARPVEWLNICWTDENKTAIQIKNAKTKLSEPAFLRKKMESDEALEVDEVHLGKIQDRETDYSYDSSKTGQEPSAPKYRVVPVESENDRRAIDLHLSLLEAEVLLIQGESERKKAYDVYYGNCRKALTRACNFLWEGKKHYSLYTMRGQFAANIKAAKGSAVAAELMGHTSETSPSAASYGKGNQAHPKFKGLRPSNQLHNAQVAQAVSRPGADRSGSENDYSVE